jgi:hypothetical protein
MYALPVGDKAADTCRQMLLSAGAFPTPHVGRIDDWGRQPVLERQWCAWHGRPGKRLWVYGSCVHPNNCSGNTNTTDSVTRH